ncbi:MAG: hypothetical protein HYU46_12460 [Deltaproteobacteria bacterium]|nr:hypothetical protein [Deltaproteobacteria bacterium]
MSVSDTHRSPRWVSALCVSTHPTISLDLLVLRYPAACCGVVHFYREIKAHKMSYVTLDLLWREYKEQYPEGYQVTRFSVLYRRWQKKLDYSTPKLAEPPQLASGARGRNKTFVD